MAGASGFHADSAWNLAPALQARGLAPAKAGELALFGLWTAPAASEGGSTYGWHREPEASRRALVEQCAPSSVRELCDKARLADFLLENGVDHWAPPTASSISELRAFRAGCDVIDGIWFLKHSLLARNAGVSAHRGRDACLQAWLERPEAERGDYLAQAEVPRLLLHSSGRKLTLRVYVLLVAHRCWEPGEGGGARSSSSERCPQASALARRAFVCRLHPKAYDAGDPDPDRHVRSTLGDAGVGFLLSGQWEHRYAAWPRICGMLADCLGPFLPSFAASEARPERGGRAGARVRSFDLLGADVLVDEDLRPWLLELNRMPALAAVPGDAAATAAREAVLEDLLAVVLDPHLAGASLGGPLAVPPAWELVCEWVRS